MMLSPPAMAQAKEGASGNSFAADFFAPFNPVTAEDMIRRIPGFTLDSGDDRRGFAGAAGNVLINGERPSSKVPLAEQLSRISARDVMRIDVRAGGGDGDLSGQTMVADVRLRPREAGATNTFVAQASQMDPSGNINPLLIFTSGFKVGDVNLNLALQAQPSRRGRIEYDKTVRTAAGALVSQGPEFLQGNYWEYRLNGRASWKLSETDSFNLNLSATPSRDGRHTFSETYSASGLLTQIDDSKVDGDNSWSIEAGGDWEHRLSDQTSFKLIALASDKHTGSAERYTTLFTSGAFRNTFINRAADNGEYVARGVFSWKPGSGHAIDWGGEAAFNFLDSELNIAVQTPLTTIDATPPVANTRVEEQRAEAFITDFWQLTPDLKLEAGVTVETSRITQSGDATQERDFTYFKPRLGATWSIDPGNQLRVMIEQDVAQLDFTEFASAVSLFDGTLDLGNPDLEPERTWRATAEWEHRFGPKGVVVVSLFNDEVEAVQDQIPIAGISDGPGNLGDGRRTGARIDATAPLDILGLKGGEMRLKGMAQTSSVDDPVTGRSRRFSEEPDWSYSIDIRQPLPDLKLLWGALYERADDVELFRLKELRTTGWDDANLDLYVETTAFTGFVVRFTVSDVLLPTEVRERRFFSPDRLSNNNLSSIETRDAKGGYGTRSYGIRVSGRF
ncbi:MAG: TonB-dependent receptor [Hyphomonadaceae bacterium]|nr:TonB-dependent receptor [Hyphomonadaceae bacterium]